MEDQAISNRTEELVNVQLLDLYFIFRWLFAINVMAINEGPASKTRLSELLISTEWREWDGHY